MRYLSDLKVKQLAGKTALVRVDFNIENSKENFRLKSSLPTIKFLLKSNARVLLISHRGRPTIKIKNQGAKSEDNLEYGLKVVAPFLRKNTGKSITFINHFDFPKIKHLIAKAPAKSVFLLENLRYLAGEEKNELNLGRSLASLGDIFVNDAFSVCHRKNASITELPKFLPSYAGLLLEKEIKNLTRVMRKPKKPLVIILGGSKVKDKIGIISYFLKKADALLIGGAAANTFFKAKNADIGESIYEPEMIGLAKKLLTARNIILPVDFIRHNRKFLDIGPLTVINFKQHIAKARTIIWNGPMGLFEDPRFINGSEEIARAITSSRGFTVAGGGETTYLIHNLGLENKFGFLSTGGGAMLKYLSGKKLPGIQSLN